MAQAYPLGRRGQRPVTFSYIGHPAERREELLKIPGVELRNGVARSAWDAAGTVARTLGLPPPTVPRPGFAETPLPGLARYRELGLPSVLFQYQKEAAQFLIHRAWALLADPMRSGKSLVALAAAELLGLRKVLVLCPAIARLGWADQITRWIKDEPLLLRGRGLDEATWVCKACLGRGVVEEAGSEFICRSCKPARVKGGLLRGQRVLRVTRFGPEPAKKGTTAGPACVAPWKPSPGRCAKHKYHPPGPQTRECPACREALDSAITRARFVVVNYDLLIPQTASFRGMLYNRDDLPGWADRLAKERWDLVIADELHWLRGRPTSRTAKDGRREAAYQVAEKADRVWGLTGTPIYGFVRDLWSQLNFLSKGLWGKKWFDFDVRYCGGQRGEYGWEADGSTPLAETELVERLSVVMLKRPRSVILAEQPQKTRQVIRLDPDKPLKRHKAFANFNDRKSATTKALAETFKLKLSYVVEALVAEMLEGGKCVAFVYNVASAYELGQKLTDALNAREHRRALSNVSARIWAVSGQESAEARASAARAFREHKGAGIFVSTIESVREGISLKGAQSVHYVDLHWLPAPLLQSEDRPYEFGCKVAIIYWLIKGSIDEHIEALVMPRFRALEKTMNESTAGDLISAFGTDDEEEEETLEQIWARMTANVPDDVEEIGEYTDE